MRALGLALALVALGSFNFADVAHGAAPATAGGGAEGGLLQSAPEVFGVAFQSGDEVVGTLVATRFSFLPQQVAACPQRPVLRREGEEVPCEALPAGSHACPVCSFAPLSPEPRRHAQALSKCRRYVGLQPVGGRSPPRFASPPRSGPAPRHDALLVESMDAGNASSTGLELCLCSQCVEVPAQRPPFALKHAVLTEGAGELGIWAASTPLRADDPVEGMDMGGDADDSLTWGAGAAAVWLEVVESAQHGAAAPAGAVDAHRYLVDGVPSSIFSANHVHKRAAEHVAEEAAMATASTFTPREQLDTIKPALSRLGLFPNRRAVEGPLGPASRGSSLRRHVDDLVRRHQSAAVEHLSSAVAGLRSVNISAHDEPGGVGQEERACPLAAVPFPVHVPGRVSWLQRELNGGGAFLIGNLGHVAGPAVGSAKIMVYGPDSGVDQDTIWLADALQPWRFEVGEVVLLRGFQHVGNTGMFEVVAKPARNVLQLGEILPTVVQFGRPAWLTAERNVDHARLIGCYGEVVGPGEGASATASGAKATSRPALLVHPGTRRRSPTVCASSRDFRMGRFEAGELVRLQGFLFEGNAGVFRVIRVVDRCVELEEARPCEAGRLGWLRMEANMQGAQLIGEHGVSTKPSSPAAPLQVRGIESALTAASKAGNVLPRNPPLPPSNASSYRGPDSVRVHPDLGAACSLFPEGSIVSLRGFQAAGNVGRFVVARCIANSTLVLREPEAHNHQCPAMPHPVASAVELQQLADGVGKAGTDGLLLPQARQSPESAASGYIPPLTDIGHAIQGAEATRLGTRKLPTPRKATTAAPQSTHCPLNCSYSHGVCNNQTGACECESTWSGHACEVPAIPCAFDCTGNGRCDPRTGRCRCDPTWRGAACDRRDLPCPMDCSGHGQCAHEEGKCDCEPTWTGVACSQRVLPCPRNCTGTHGRCDYSRGKCLCEPTWSGVACAAPALPCPKGCSGHGECESDKGRCQCDLDWLGIACDRQDLGCPSNCTDEHHGVCNPATQECECRPAWTGFTCGTPRCGEHGAMREDGSCECDENWFSPLPDSVCKLEPELCQCSRTCAADGSTLDTCAGRGLGCTETGECQCRVGWSGTGCEIPLIVTGELNQGHVPTEATKDQFPDSATLRCCSTFTQLARCRDNVKLREEITPDDVRCILDGHGRPKDGEVEQAAMVSEVFGGDSDGNGVLDYSEFSRICTTKPLRLVSRVVTWAFAELDVDGDGIVTAEDMVQVFGQRDARAQFTIGGGNASSSEVPAPLSDSERSTLSEEQEAEAERLLSMCDRAGDGVCSIPEYAQMVGDTCPECLCATCPMSLQPDPGASVSECCGAFGADSGASTAGPGSDSQGGGADDPEVSDLDRQEEEEAERKDKAKEELKELESQIRTRREQEELKKAGEIREERERRSEEEGVKQDRNTSNHTSVEAEEEKQASEKAEQRRRREEEAGKSDDAKAEEVLRRDEDSRVDQLEEEVEYSSPVEVCSSQCQPPCRSDCAAKCILDRADGKDVIPWGGMHHLNANPESCTQFVDPPDACKDAASPADCWGEEANERVQELATCMGIANSDPNVLGRDVLEKWKVRAARACEMGPGTCPSPAPSCVSQRAPRPIQCVDCRKDTGAGAHCTTISEPVNCPTASSLFECWPVEYEAKRAHLVKCLDLPSAPSRHTDHHILKLWKVRSGGHSAH